MRFENNGPTTSKEEFQQVTAMMNLIAITQFFETICTGIFRRPLVARSIKGGLLGLVSTYFGTVEINGQGILYLYYLLWLQSAFY